MIFHKKQFISKEKDKSLRKGRVQKGDFILTTRGTLGNFAYNDGEIFSSIRINSGMMIMRINNKEKLSSSYFYQYLSSSKFKKQVQTMSSGSAQPQLPLRDLKNIKIKLPHLETQKKIAHMLSVFDEKIEVLRKENQALEELAQALYKRWFVEFNFPDEDGNPYRENGGKMIDSELGPIPEGWRVGKLGEIAKVSSGKRPKSMKKEKDFSHKVPVIGASKKMGYVEESLYDGKTLVIGRVGTHGLVQRFQEKIYPSDNTLVIKSDYLNFVYIILKEIDYSILNRGAVQPLITQTDIKEYPLILPRKVIFDSYLEMTDKLFLKFNNNEEQIQTLSETKERLLSKLI